MNSCRHSLILQFPRCFLIPVLCLLVLLTPTDTLAQQNFQWRNFTRFIDGLSSNDVRFITEDRRGQLWLATSNGLSHFDGFWHAIDVSDNNPNANDVSSVLITSSPLATSDFIWAATNAGSSRANSNTLLIGSPLYGPDMLNIDYLEMADSG